MNSTTLLKSLQLDEPVTQDNRKWSLEGRNLMAIALSQSHHVINRYLATLAYISKLITERTAITANPQSLNGEEPGSVMHDAYLMQLDIANKVAIATIMQRVPTSFDQHPRTHHLITLLGGNLTTHPGLMWVNGLALLQPNSTFNYGDCVLISEPLPMNKLVVCLQAFEQQGLYPRAIKCKREDGVDEDRILIEKAAIATTPTYYDGMKSSCFPELLELSQQMNRLMRRLREVKTMAGDEECRVARGYYGMRN